MQHEDLALADLIIEAMPAPEELIAWYWKYPNFRSGLKFTNHDRFYPVGALSRSHSPRKPKDIVYGFFVYDRDLQTFKQDYIVDVQGDRQRYVLYTKRPDKQYDRQVQPISTFFADYDTAEQKYRQEHHLSQADVESLKSDDPEFLRSMVRKAVARAHNTPVNPSQKELRETLAKIRLERHVPRP